MLSRLQAWRQTRRSGSQYMLATVGGVRTCADSRSSIIPLNSSLGVKFVMYKSNSPHPIFGDESREVTANAKKETMECLPDRAVVALRHPRLSGMNLENVRQAYASKLQVGGPAVVVDDDSDIFGHVQLMDDWGKTMSVMLDPAYLRREVEACARFKVPASQVFGGWPARNAELTYPVSRLAEDVGFMWPETVYERVMVKRDGEPVDPETCLGSLLREPEALQVTVNSIDYPLELDVLASRASQTASKQAGRQRLIQVLLDELRFCVKMWPLFLFWIACECQMYKSWRYSRIEQPRVKSPQELLGTKQPQDEFAPNQVDFSNFAFVCCMESSQGWNQGELLVDATLGQEEIPKGWGEVALWSSNDVPQIHCEDEESAE